MKASLKNFIDSFYPQAALKLQDHHTTKETFTFDHFYFKKYEFRKQEIKHSKQPIEGIFFIYQNKIVPDFFTECLASDSVFWNCERSSADRCSQMYLETFYKNYMIKRFSELKLSATAEYLPRGRTHVLTEKKALFVDDCFVNDSNMIKEILKLYRLPLNTIVIPKYTCPNCR